MTYVQVCVASSQTEEDSLKGGQRNSVTVHLNDDSAVNVSVETGTSATKQI